MQPDIELVFGRVALIDDYGQAVHDGTTVDWLNRAHDFLSHCSRLDVALANENFAVSTSNFVFTKALWQRNNGFQALRYCHDMDFVFASIEKAHVLYDQKVEHIDYRVHQANTIKEDENRVRVEIACVLACALHGQILGVAKDVLDERMLGLFDKALNNKGLGNLVPFLAARRSAFANRNSFYDWAIGNDQVNQILLRQVEGLLAGQGYYGCEPLAPLYVAGNGAPVAPTSVARPVAPLSFSGVIAVELSAFDRGGLEKVVLDTSAVMREHGLNSIIISCGKVGHLGKIARNLGFIVYELSQTNPQDDYRQILRRHDVKLSVSHFSRVGYPVFAELGIPNVTFIHNVYAFLNGEALNNFMADDRYVDTYISVSPKATDYATSQLDVAREKIVTVPNGLVINEHITRAKATTPVTRDQFGIRPDDYVFLNVASYNLHKNHYLMAEAMQMVLKKTDNIKILCIGNTIVPHHIEGLRTHIGAIGIANHMLMPGYFPDVAPFHAIADAFLLPSLIEGWSIAMNEAMFFGKPMLLTDTGGSSEVIINNDIGILLPNEYGDVSNLHSELLDDIAYNQRTFRTSAYLARAMMQFAENPGTWRDAGKKGTQRILDKYDFTDTVKSYFPIFEAIIKRQSGKVEQRRP
jgi:glycosyltransferase involved in cell wall biosynthesis